MADAIHTEGLTKRYGETLALDSLDLAVREGEVYGYLGPNGAGKTTTIRLLLGLHRATAGRAELFGVDAWGDPLTAHRRVAYVPGEPFLWPKLTAAETFEFLARLHGGTDVAYRDQLVERFKLDYLEAGQGALQGQPPEGPARRGARDARRPIDPRRADKRPRPADGGCLPRERARGEGARADRLPLLPHPQRGGGALRPGRDPQQRQAGGRGEPGRDAAPRPARRS
jgi:ABC-type sugar transport system ATPase subunit